MPKIRDMLRERFGAEKLRMDIDPDVTVAYGAAMVA
jgi:molecular chaperone DnaK (HSP70)